MGIHGANRAAQVDVIADEYGQGATLTIEAGRYYRTRDGRKVGPMQVGSVGPFVWESDDCFYDEAGVAPGIADSHDIIAEWVEPQVEPVAGNDDEPMVFKDGTMFIDALKCGPTQLHVTKGALVKTTQGYGFELARYGNYVWVDTGKKAPICMRAATVTAA